MDRLISEQAVIKILILLFIGSENFKVAINSIKAIPSAEPKTGHCEDCKYFRELPYHIDILGKCFQHTGFCPKGDWYCADFEPQESEG